MAGGGLVKRRGGSVLLSVFLIPAGLAVFSLAQDQVQDSCSFFPGQEIRVSNLAPPTTPSKDTDAVIAAAVEAVLHDPSLCCGKDSTLGDSVIGPRTLKELASKLQGRHLASDGRPMQVSAEYDAQNAINAGLVIGALQQQRALLFEWKSHVYVLYGAIYGEERCVSGARHYSIAKLLLLDPRYSDQRREAVFNRETDDLSKVQGMLSLSVAPQ